MTISPISGISSPNGITGTITGISNAGGLSSQASSGPAPTYATWSEALKASQSTLSNGDLTVTSGVDGWRTGFSATELTTGKWIWECIAGNNGEQFFGVGAASVTINTPELTKGTTSFNMNFSVSVSDALAYKWNWLVIGKGTYT